MSGWNPDVKGHHQKVCVCLLRTLTTDCCHVTKHLQPCYEPTRLDACVSLSTLQCHALCRHIIEYLTMRKVLKSSTGLADMKGMVRRAG